MSHLHKMRCASSNLVGNLQDVHIAFHYHYLDTHLRAIQIFLHNHLAVTTARVAILVVGQQLFEVIYLGHAVTACIVRRLDDMQRQIREVAEAACKSLGVDKGPAHVEMKVTSARGPVMIELGARMGGDNITTHLVPLSTGIDMVKATINVALGEEPDITPTLHCGSAIRYFEVPFGTIKSIEGVEEAEKMTGVKQIIFTKTVGEGSTPIECSNDRIGFVIAQGATADEATKKCEEAIKRIQITIQK